jgi:hypothetical protein
MLPRSLFPPLAFILLAPSLPAEEAVPPPAKTPARVIVSGRTSTFDKVQTAAVGAQIPRTFSGDRVKNTPGFSWYVSQHYALKTDYPAERARAYLELLELAYPHYVEQFGREPEGLAEKRMAVVYASSAEQLKKALLSDGIAWNFNGGGITFEGYFCAYQYPSGTLMYHQRYIVLHECAHLFQMCLNGTLGTMPSWYNEGVADSLGHHVHDPVRNQLTVHVFDKATITNYLDDALATQRRKPIVIQEVHKAGGAGREVGFLLVHYFSDDPNRLQRFRIWRDEMFRLRQHGKDQQELSARLLQDLFGPWPKMEADFQGWVNRRCATFHYVAWGWEQEGNTLWSYGFADKGQLSQTDVNLPPCDKVKPDPFRMDYPTEPMPALVGPVRRGAAEPVIGAVIDFSRSVGRGRTGIGLGVSQTPAGSVRLLIEAGRQLVLDGADLGLQRKVVDLPADLRQAMVAGGQKLGLTVRIGEGSLDVTVKARAANADKDVILKAALPLDEPSRKRLLSQPLALLSRDGIHGVTPCFDDGRPANPDLSIPAPANRWRNPGDAQLGRLVRATWRLGDRTPASLSALREQMLEAAERAPEAQAGAMLAYQRAIAGVRQDVRNCGAGADSIAQALAELDEKGR